MLPYSPSIKLGMWLPISLKVTAINVCYYVPIKYQKRQTLSPFTLYF